MSWKDTLLDASFKGVGFDVIDDTLRGTHALAEHEYPFETFAKFPKIP